MTWRDWFYVLSLIVLWGFLISGPIVRKEKIFSKQLFTDFKKNWMYYFAGVWMPQMYIILVVVQIIFDFKGFKEMVINHYKIKD